MFLYVVLIPVIVSALLWQRKSELQYAVSDLLCAYGYSLSIFVPVSVSPFQLRYYFCSHSVDSVDVGCELVQVGAYSHSCFSKWRCARESIVACIQIGSK